MFRSGILIRKAFFFFIPALLLLASCKSQAPVSEKNYAERYTIIDSLIQKRGLREDALKQVKEVYAMAVQEKNAAEQIKALIYSINLAEPVSDKEIPVAISTLEQEIPASEAPARYILHSLLAEQYQRFLQQNRWKIYNRTPASVSDSSDISTWSAADLHRKISAHYQASLAEPALLKSVDLSRYEPVIIKGNTRHLRPTLFDLLAFRALEYYENDERDVSQPAKEFLIDQNAAFDPADQFIRVRFHSPDSSSLHFKALLLYQELIRFHISDTTPDALIDADIHRLSFVRRHATQTDRDEIWLMNMNHIAHQYNQTPAAAQAWFLLAEYWSQKAATYQPFGDTTHRYAYTKAMEICNQVIQQKDSSEGKINCINLKAQIESPTLQLQSENVNLPGIPFRSLVSFKNIPELHIRIAKISDTQLKEITEEGWYEESFWKKATQLPALRSEKISLPRNTDYQQHSAEIKTEALPVGTYLLLAGNEPGFQPGKSAMAAQVLRISNLAFLQKDSLIYVVHRDSGKPLPGVTVEKWRSQYDYNTRKNIEKKEATVITGKDGMVILPSGNDRESRMKIILQSGNDRLVPSENIYIPYRYPVDQKPVHKSFLFSDRSIYRPGQLVQLKGLITLESPGEKTVVPAKKTTVILYDANHQAIDSLKVTTNAFGSWSGSFRLPEGGLNGNFEIRDPLHNGHLNFKVEEYKRPTFSVNLNAPEGMIRLNDSVQVKGNAIAFAGNNITGASVAYRVVRKQWNIYPYYASSRIWPPFPQQETEIAHGTVPTDEAGNFTIPFLAIPDQKTARNKTDIFHYVIEADVTDANGETRSATTSLNIGYAAINLSFELPSEMVADSLKKITVRADNSAGKSQKVPATIRIRALQEPGQTFRERYWERPDQYTMSAAEYRKHFPLDLYANEHLPTEWPVRPKVLVNLSDTAGKAVALNTPLAPGWYVLEAEATDAFGEKATTKQYIQLTGKEINNPLFTIETNALPAEIKTGTTQHVHWQTNIEDAFILKELNRSDDRTEKELLASSSGKLPVKIQEPDRGGISVSLLTVKNNRFYEHTASLNVPWSNKEIEIKTGSFRNKLEPGSKETWTVSLRMKEGKLDAAEMLAGMYDASLDAFTTHNWSRPSWPRFYVRNRWQDNNSFRQESAHTSIPDVKYMPLEKSYDALLVPDNYWNNTVMIRGRASGIVAEAAPDFAKENNEYSKVQTANDEVVTVGYAQQGELFVMGDSTKKPQPSSPTPIRSNFSETAFFFPHLLSDEKGTVSFSFTMPESVTEWKWMSFAHTKNLASGYMEQSVVTQKNLMVQPNLPRFLREGDRMDLSARIANTTDKEMTGQIELQLLDAETRKPVDGWFQNIMPNQYFTAAAKSSANAQFSIQIPYKYGKPLVVRIIARSGNTSDGEETILPVLANKMLVTESFPLYMRGNGTQEWNWEKLLNSGNSETLTHQAVTVEFTSNPTWFVLQALPVLAETENASVEQQFSRFYAHAMASGILKKAPRLQSMIKEWMKGDTAALMSQLEKNPELKAVLLEETPWVLEAKNEKEQRRRIGLLLNLPDMQKSIEKSLRAVMDMQTPNGGFAWFPGGADNRYMTQHILQGIGHLKNADMLPSSVQKDIQTILRKAVPYLDQRLQEDYIQLLKTKAKLTEIHTGPSQVFTLYIRSFFPEIPVAPQHTAAYTYYRKQAVESWLQQSIYQQGMTALMLMRNKQEALAKNILESLKQNAIKDSLEGMYWKQNQRGYYWHQSPIETQALLIEAFAEAGRETEVNEMKTWLIRRKQTTQWSTSTATTKACYAILLKGAGFTEAQPEVMIQLGNQTMKAEHGEAGTGYFKQSIVGEKVTPELGKIKVSIQNNAAAAPAWGSVYWQYFEQLDQITASEKGTNDLSLKREYFIRKNTASGPVLSPIDNLTSLKPGDPITIRMILKTERDMDFVHLKDQRPAGLEPTEVLSRYQWNSGLGYYQTTKDASVQYFFDRLPKGTHVLEYTAFITHTGVFSTGIGSLQCLYAPEFSAHSEGKVLRVE